MSPLGNQRGGKVNLFYDFEAYSKLSLRVGNETFS
jgi:hypothetical protein